MYIFVQFVLFTFPYFAFLTIVYCTVIIKNNTAAFTTALFTLMFLLQKKNGQNELNKTNIINAINRYCKRTIIVKSAQ